MPTSDRCILAVLFVGVATLAGEPARADGVVYKGQLHCEQLPDTSGPLNVAMQVTVNGTTAAYTRDIGQAYGAATTGREETGTGTVSGDTIDLKGAQSVTGATTKAVFIAERWSCQGHRTGRSRVTGRSIASATPN
jgi:hypothetical protein